MSENNIIKSIVSHVCPSCKQEIFIESQMAPSSVTAVFTQKEVDTAKQDLLSRIETLTIEEEKKESVRKWIRDPNTIFGPSEIESIVLSLLKPE